MKSNHNLICTFISSTQASSVLLDILKKVAEIDTKMFVKSSYTKIEQALSHHYELAGTNRLGVLKFHPAVGRLYKSYLSQMGDLSFETNKLPMLIPPRPWTSATSGAYMLLHCKLWRFYFDAFFSTKCFSRFNGSKNTYKTDIIDVNLFIFGSYH